MRKLFELAVLACLLLACSSDPVFHGMTPQQKEAYAKALAGQYKGTYVILYNDGGSDVKAEKIEGAAITVTDMEMQSVVFHDYPVSLLAHAVKDAELAEALSKQPNIDISATYRFYDYQDNGDVSWGYDLTAIPLTLHYGGADHHVMLKVSNAGTFCRLTKDDVDAGTAFAGQGVFELSFIAIYEGDVLLQDFDTVWQDNAYEFRTYFQFDK